MSAVIINENHSTKKMAKDINQSFTSFKMILDENFTKIYFESFEHKNMKILEIFRKFLNQK
jgi:hypothetical protein